MKVKNVLNCLSFEISYFTHILISNNFFRYYQSTTSLRHVYLFLSSRGTSTVDLGCVSIYLFVYLSCPSALNFKSPNLYLGKLLLFQLFVHVMVRYPYSYFCRFWKTTGLVYLTRTSSKLHKPQTYI